MASFIGKTIYGTDTEDPSLVNNSYDTVKKILGLGSIAGATYFGFKKPATQISNSLKNFSERRRTQLSETGFSIRESVLQSGETIDQIRRAALEEQAEKLTTDESISAILEENSSRRKAVLQSVIDHLVTLEGTDTELQGFSKLKDELLDLISSEERFDNETIDKIKSHIHGITTNENSRHRFLNSFRRYENIGHLISGARTPFQNPSAPVLESSLDSIFKGSNASSVKGKVNYRLGIIKRLQGSIEGFRVIDEFGSEAARDSFKSIYAQVQFGGQTQMVPLHLQQSKRGLSFIRTTRELSTRYSAPKAIMRAEKLLEIDKSSLSKAGKIQAFEQEASRNIVDDLFDFLGGMRDSGQLINFNRSQSNFVGERLRAFSEVVSAGVALPTGGFFDETTRQNILASHLLQSNKAIVTGIGGLPEREQRNLVSRLASQYSDFFDSTNAGATMRRTLEGPFGARESFTQITMGREFTPFSVMSNYAPFDRTIMPTTARESQLIGRPEHFLPAIGKTDPTEVLDAIPRKRYEDAYNKALRFLEQKSGGIGNIFKKGLGNETKLINFLLSSDEGVDSLNDIVSRSNKIYMKLKDSSIKRKLTGVGIPFDTGNFDDLLIREGQNIYESSTDNLYNFSTTPSERGTILKQKQKIKERFLNQDQETKNRFFRLLGLESFLEGSVRREANRIAIEGLERDGYRIQRNEKGDFFASRDRKGFGEFFGFSEGAGKVKRFGSGSELLSISSRGEGIAGINMAAIMFADNEAARRAGLAEGMAYSGSDLRLRRQFTKTIDADAVRFSSVEKLLARDSQQLTLRGQKKIAEFFERNNNILGYLDGEQIEIPRFTGMEELKIAVSEEVEGSGKKKLKFSFEATEVTANNKAFSALVKGDLLSLGSNKEAFIDVLESGLAGTRADAESMLGLFERRFGVSTRDSLISTFDMGTKGPKYATDIMYGGMRMMGFEESTLKGKFSNIVLQGDTAVSRQKQYLKDFTSAALELLKNPPGNLDKKEEQQLIGYLLGGMQTLEKEGKFGLKEGEIDKLIESKLGGSSLDVSEIIRASKRGVIFGASSVFAGSSASILRSNLAKFEPRVANYLAENLRNIHGISDTEIADYMATFISRQQGSVEKMNMAPILKMMTSSMSPLANKEVLEKEVLSLGDDFKVLKFDEIESLRASIGGGDKSLRQQLEILGRDKKAIGVDIDEYVRGFASTNKETKDAVAKHLKSRFRSDQLILPGQDVLENMIGMKIKTAQAGQEIEIENAFIRNLMAMKEQIRRATSAESADAAIDILKSGPFEQIITDVNATTGSIIRNIASGSVLGSATLQGQGIVLGFEGSKSKGTVQSFSDFEDAIRSGIVNVDGQGKVSFANRVEARKAVQKEYMRRMSGAFNRSGGKALYLDTQAFMDATKTYMSAMEKSLAAEGVKAEEIPELAKRRSMETMKSFFYEMTNVRHGFDPVTGLSLRNPILGPSHLFPNMHLYRSDFFDNKKLFDALNVERFKSFDTIKRFVEERTVDGKQRKFNMASIFDYLAEMESVEKVKVLNRGKLKELTEEQDKKAQEIRAEIQEKENLITKKEELKKSQPKGRKGAKSRRRIEKNIGDLQRVVDSRKAKLASLMGEDLTEEAMDLQKGSDITSRFFREFSRRYESRIGTGGGNIIFPAFDAEIEYRAGQETKTISTRFDITKFGIGDFDGDYYQLFIDTKQNMREITEGVSMPKQFAYGARFEVMMKQISSGMANIGERLNVSSLNIEDFLYSEAKKEEILKNVGGLDIEVKTAMLGMALDYESGAGDLNKRFNTLSFLTTAQEVLNIKAKKLPMASEVADIFALHLRDSFKTGSTQGLETFIRDQLFKDTEILEGIEIQGIKFQNVGEQAGTVFQEISDQASKNTRLSVDSVIEGLREAVQSVRTRGLDHLGSNRKIINLMSSDNAFRDMKAFQRLVQESQTLETALSSRGREQVDAVEELLRRLEPQRMTPGSMLTGKAGAALAGIMAGSYLLGNSGAPEVLNPQNTFSDYKVRNALQAQNAMSDGLDRAMNPAQTTAGMQQNIINRPINTGQYYTQTSNVRLSGNAPSMEAAYNMSSAISRSGGRSLVSINDTRQPITGNYIDRLLGE